MWVGMVDASDRFSASFLQRARCLARTEWAEVRDAESSCRLRRKASMECWMVSFIDIITRVKGQAEETLLGVDRGSWENAQLGRGGLWNGYNLNLFKIARR